MRRLFHSRADKVDLLEKSAKSIRLDLELAVRELYASAAEQRVAADRLQKVAEDRMTATHA